MSPIWETFGNDTVQGFRTFAKGVTYFLARVTMATRGTSQPQIAGTAANVTHSYYGFATSYGKFIHRFTQDGLFVESVTILGTGSNGIGSLAGNDSLVSSGCNSAQRVWTPANYYGTMVFVKNNANANCLDTNIDTSNNVYFQGYGVSPATLNKYNSSGTLQWQKQVASTGIGVADTLGNTFTATTGANPVVHKLDTNGNYVWGRQISQYSTATLGWIKGDGAGGVFLSSNISSGITSVIRLDSTGAASWGRQVTVSTYNTTSFAYGPDGSYYWLMSGASGNEAYLVKFNNSGTVIWQRSFIGAGLGASNNGYASSNLHVDANAIYLAFGTYSGNGAYEFTYCFKYPVDGSVQGTYALGNGNIAIAASGITINSFTPTPATSTSSAANSSGDNTGTGAPSVYTTSGQQIIKVP